MKPGTYRLKEDAFIFDKGDIFDLRDGTYDSEICDICGNRRMCDWLIYFGDHHKAGFDCCRSCQKKILEPCEEPEGIEDKRRSLDVIGAYLAGEGHL
jgi:hypothetical protein